MTEASELQITGTVQREAGRYRTWTGASFPTGHLQRIEVPGLLPEDLHTLQAATGPLQLLFPHLEWAEWGVEIVEGHHALSTVLSTEQTLVIERHGLGEVSLLAWDLYGAFLRTMLLDDHAGPYTDEELQYFAIAAQFQWFYEESYEWQYEILASLALPGMDRADLAGLLWSYLPHERAQRLKVLLRDQAMLRQLVPRTLPFEKRCWQAAAAYQQRLRQLEEHGSSTSAAPTTAPVPPNIDFHQRFARKFQVCNLLPWSAMSSALPGMLVRYFQEVESNASSTERRLSLFRLCAKQMLTQDPPQFNPTDWPRLSLAVLNPGRHAKIYQALQEFLESTTERETHVLWSARADEAQLARLAVRNQLGEQDDRFFRQATHIQAIWRDILHRSASQEWASDLLFDALERLIKDIQKDTELFYAAVIWNRAVYETAASPTAPEIENLRALLWVLSQAPLAVLRRLYPQELEEATQARYRWRLLSTHIKRFLHLAPPVLLRLLEQVEEERHQTKEQGSPFDHIDLQTDNEIPQQDLHGRILPLLSRPELRQQRWIDLDQTKALRIIHLDRYLHQSSGLLKEQRFFSSFLFFFKTENNITEGNWSDLALWIDKDLDLSKLAQKKGLSPTIRGLLLEDGIWERTYRYQFLTMDQLLQKLQPDAEEWRQLLQLLITEYRPLFFQRIKELLSYHFYTTRYTHLQQDALVSALDLAEWPPFFSMSVGDFEAYQSPLANDIVTRIFQRFLGDQFQDDRSWRHAHQSIVHMLQQATQLLRFPTARLLESPKTSDLIHQSCRAALLAWQPEADAHSTPELPALRLDFATPPPLPRSLQASSWSQDKLAILHRLQRHYPQGAVAFTRFLLHQIHPDYKVVELLMERPFDDQEQRVHFKPIPTSAERSGRRREMVTYLRDRRGHLLPPSYVEILLKVPVELLREALAQHPPLTDSLARAAELLRELQFDPDKHPSFWENLEGLLRPLPKEEVLGDTPQEKRATNPADTERELQGGPQTS